VSGARRDRRRPGDRERAPRDTQRWTRAAPGTPTPTTRPTTRPDAASRRTTVPPDEALHPRDRGPVRAYVRDVVDSRRHGLVGLFVPGFGGTLIAALGPASNLQRWLLVICAALLAVALVDAVVLGRTATRRARARYPGKTVDGWRTGWYAFMRAHRMRNLRLPPPRVDRGDPVP
jgi:hypothetical protein